MNGLEKFNRLGLGTVQFGLDYGVSNKNGRTPLREAEEIISLADDVGVRVIDTAALYGDAEKILGRVLPTDHHFDIITKTERFQKEFIDRADADRLIERFKCSLDNMRIGHAYGLLIHGADDLISAGGEWLFEAMGELKMAGFVDKIGASVYTEEQIANVLQRFPIDIIQLPLNVHDQRFIRSGQLAELGRRGIEIHARSVFLQGLLLMAADDLPIYFKSAYPIINHYQNRLKNHGISLQTAALSFVKNIAEIDCLIIGVNSRRQLLENLSAFVAGCELDFADFAIEKEEIINPSIWQLR